MTNSATHSRKTKIVQANKMALRETLQAGEYMRQIEEVSVVINENWKTLDTNQIQALKLKTDINFKRLNKVLPDLKSVEIKDGTGTNKHEDMLKLLDKRSTIIDVTPEDIVNDTSQDTPNS